MVLMMTNLRDYCLENHKNLLVVKCLALMKASHWDYVMVKRFAIYLKYKWNHALD